MDSERWQRLQTLFDDAADMPPGERLAYLEAACGEDRTMLAEALQLLEQDARPSPTIDDGAGLLAGRLIAAARLSAPLHIGPYRMIRYLGEGGMGVVYLAERADLGQKVAIKLLREGMVSPARRERFAIEQRTLARLEHPFIARLYDAQTSPDGTSWFAMEFIDGQPLTTFCSQRKLGVRHRLSLFRSVCEAVQYAHGNLIIHRDLKPSNILVTENGAVHLLDFGIAKQLDETDSETAQTRTGLPLMTPAYAAPEQLRGEPTGIFTDIYSLGVILKELLAGAGPAQNKRRRGTPNSELDIIRLKAMHEEPPRRYKTVDALIRDVDHFLNDEPLDARPDTAAYRLRKFISRNRRSVLTAAAALLFVAVLVTFFLVRLTRAKDEALTSAARERNVEQFMLGLFTGGDEEAGPAADLKVATLVDRGVQQARTLSGEPAVQAKLYDTLGSVYLNLGQLEHADSLLRLALERRRVMFRSPHSEVAESLVNLGKLRAAQAKFDDAERLVREGLAMLKSLPAAGKADIGSAATALGQVLENRGRYGAAIAALEEAADLLSAPEVEPAKLAQCLTELANCHFYAGNYDKANELNHRVLALDRQIYGGNNPAVADDLINLGAIQFQWGACDKAEAYDRQALAIDQAWYGPQHPETASVMTILARALICQGHYEEAETLLQRALAVQEKIYGPVHPRIASALNELGAIALRQGRLGAAEKFYRRQRTVYQAVYGDGHYLSVLGMVNIGRVCFERREYARAESIFAKAVEDYTRTLSATHQFTAIAHIFLGRTLLHEQKFAAAERETRTGFELLKKVAPRDANLATARRDLIEIYTALRMPEKLGSL